MFDSDNAESEHREPPAGHCSTVPPTLEQASCGERKKGPAQSAEAHSPWLVDSSVKDTSVQAIEVPGAQEM